MTANATWQVIYTASRQEKKVAVMLERHHIQHYLPLVKKLRLWSDRKKWVEMPLFNGYIFVQPKPTERDQVLQIPGVVKYLKYNGQDAQLSATEIKTIRSLIDTGFHIEQADKENFMIGDRVVINQGPMKGIEAVIVKTMEDDYTLYLNFETIYQTIKIKTDKRILSKYK